MPTTTARQPESSFGRSGGAFPERHLAAHEGPQHRCRADQQDRDDGGDPPADAWGGELVEGDQVPKTRSAANFAVSDNRSPNRSKRSAASGDRVAMAEPAAKAAR
jgi:hypothetical protein